MPHEKIWEEKLNKFKGQIPSEIDAASRLQLLIGNQQKHLDFSLKEKGYVKKYLGENTSFVHLYCPTGFFESAYFLCQGSKVHLFVGSLNLSSTVLIRYYMML